MVFKTKKIIPAKIKGKITQISKNQRNIEKTRIKKTPSPKLILTFKEYTALTDKLNKLLHKTYPHWTQQRINAKINETLSKKIKK
jgi:hypothetical protein